jgi:hypothetical protein
MGTPCGALMRSAADIGPLRTQLVGFAKRQMGCQTLQHHYGIDWLCAAIIWAEVGDAALAMPVFEPDEVAS